MCRSPAGTCSSMKPSCILDGRGCCDAGDWHQNIPFPTANTISLVPALADRSGEREETGIGYRGVGASKLHIFHPRREAAL